MAFVADNLVAVAGDVAVDRAGPPALDGVAHDNHRAVVGGVPVFHRLEDAQNLVVVVAVVNSEDIPAVRCPLVLDAIAVILRLNDAADKLIVDARVVVGQQDAKALADLLGNGCRLHLLRVPGGHGELALDSHNLQAVGRAHHVPERCLARRRGDADAGWPAVDIVGHVGGLRVSGKGADAANLRLLHLRRIGQVEVFQQGGKRSCAPPEA